MPENLFNEAEDSRNTEIRTEVGETPVETRIAPELIQVMKKKSKESMVRRGRSSCKKVEESKSGTIIILKQKILLRFNEWMPLKRREAAI